MGHFLFFVFVVAACLLWSAALTAAAARTHRLWLRRLLAAVAVLAPVVAVAAFVACTALLAFWKHMPTNWFGPTLTTLLSAFIGGICITWAGLARVNARPLQFSAEPVPLAARWPVVGLAAAFVMAKAVAFGTLLIIDNAVAAQAPYLRFEAAQLMQTNLPPAVPDLQNAAPLYHQAIAALDADAMLTEEGSPLTSAATIDMASPPVVDLLARHATTLDLIRRGADRDTCRFQRDWTRPAFNMLLPELQSLRTVARLLVLEARREAADGNTEDALRDVGRIHAIGRHTASEPILISNLVGLAIDTLAVETLVQVLPTLRKSDLTTLDSSDIRDLVTTPSAMASYYYGEEAVGLASFADLSDGLVGMQDLVSSLAGTPRAAIAGVLPLSLLYRVFFLPADLAGYRSIMRKYQTVASRSAAYPETMQQLGIIEMQAHEPSPGFFTSQVVPALAAVFRSQTRSVATRRAAMTLIAATKQRLKTGTVPATLDASTVTLLPPASRDPFTADHPLLIRRTESAIVVYSVGPDGEDDGGPAAPGGDKVEGNDDIGLRMAL